MSAVTGRFVWYELMTSDVAAAQAFYAAVVGWSIEDVPMAGMTYKVLRAGETPVGGLMAVPPEAARGGMRPCWIGYVSVDDVDDAAVQLQHLGGKVYRAPDDIPGVGRFAVVADPQGAVFQVFRATEPRDPPVSTGAGHVGWRELHATDQAKALAFYGAMFGWGQGQSFDLGALGTYQQFTIGGTPAGGMFNSPETRDGRFWLFYFSIGDIDAAAARVRTGGGRIVAEAHQVRGGGWIAEATDPQGARFALLGTRVQRRDGPQP